MGWRGMSAAALVVASWLAAVPDGQAQPVGGQDVSFKTADSRVGALELRGKLWPSATPTLGAVVILHGSIAWSDHREGHYARAFAAAGFEVLAVDSFGPRSLTATTEDQSQVSSLQMARDAFAASRFLQARGTPMARQAVMGFSKGGAAALFTADRTFLTNEAQRFAGTLAFYPACNTRARTPQPASLVFMALGEKDDYAGVEPCQELAAAFRASGGQVQVTVYPGASHTFDGDPTRTAVQHLRFVENYMHCRLLVEPDGSMALGERRFAAGDPKVLQAMQTTCMRKGATTWTNTRQKERATQDAVAFLHSVFGTTPR